MEAAGLGAKPWGGGGSRRGVWQLTQATSSSSSTASKHRPRALSPVTPPSLGT